MIFGANYWIVISIAGIRVEVECNSMLCIFYEYSGTITDFRTKTIELILKKQRCNIQKQCVKYAVRFVEFYFSALPPSADSYRIEAYFRWIFVNSRGIRHFHC